MSAKTAVIASEKTKLRFVPIGAVKMREGFWKAKMDANHKTGIPALQKNLEDHGVVENFMIVSGRKKVERQGPYFTDSDLYKWMEGAALDLQTYPDPKYKAELDRIIDEVAAAQGKDGYLNTYYQGERFDQRFTDLPHTHELYCAGHLFQAAVAHYRATGETKLLDVAARYADYLATTFGPDEKQGVDGHPEIEMALVELYRTTGKKSYLDLAGYFLGQLKFAEMKNVAGHAVRCMYTCCGGADYYAETGDKAFKDSGERLWDDLTDGKLYITGGVGGRAQGEAIGSAYELPNLLAYAETCAAIANAMWQYRMLAIYGEARFADEMERAFYNGVISGVSLDSGSYFYVNPLTSNGNHARNAWFGCTCCPTNMVRTLAAIPGYMYSVNDQGVWVHLFDNSKVDYKLADGVPFKLDVTTDYPWDGTVKVKLGLDAPKEFTLFVRIPDWCKKASLKVNGASETTKTGSYAAIKRQWKSGDEIELVMDMPVVMMECDPRMRENYGDVALTRGPLVYCAESIDNPDVSILDLRLTSKKFETARTKDLGGVVTIKGAGESAKPSQMSGPVYRPAGGSRFEETPVTFIPYYAWANRGQSQMTVWMPMR